MQGPGEAAGAVDKYLMSGPLNGGGLLSRVWVTIYNLWLLFPHLGALGWELGLSHPSSGSVS